MPDIKKYLDASDRAVNYFCEKLSITGQLSHTHNDPKIYYKLPMLLMISGKSSEAQKVLDFIKANFIQSNGDLRVSEAMKTSDIVLSQFDCYMNAWVLRAAHMAERFDISYKMNRFFKAYSNEEAGGYMPTLKESPIFGGRNVMCMFTTASMGYTALCMGDLQEAKKTGDYLLKCIADQPNPKKFFLLRENRQGERTRGQLITEFPAEAAAFHVIDREAPNQLYFLIGFPAAFLVNLYQATHDPKYINGSRSILCFAMDCHESIYSFHFAHKIAWAAALYANVTKDQCFTEFACKIADYLCTLQNENGLFLKDAELADQYDQSAEIGVWLRKIYTLLESAV